MPKDSGGTYSLPPQYFATPGTVIRTEQHNPIFEDVQDALTGDLPRSGVAPMTGDLNLGGNQAKGSAEGTEVTDLVNLGQMNYAISLALAESGASIDFDTQVDTLADINIDTTVAAPDTISEIPIGPGSRALFTKNIPASKNGIWQVDDDGNWMRPDDYLSGAEISSGLPSRNYRVYVLATGDTTDAFYDNTVWEMTQKTIIVDAQSSTWLKVIVNVSGSYAGDFLAGPGNPKASKAPAAYRRMTPDDLPMWLGGDDQKHRLLIWDHLQEMNLISDFFDSGFASNHLLQFQNTLSQRDEVVVNGRGWYFSSALTFTTAAKYQNNRLIFEPGRGRDGPVTLWTNNTTGGCLKFQGAGITIEGNVRIICLPAPVNTSTNASAVWFDAGAKDIAFKDGLQIENFTRGVYAAGDVNGVEIAELGIRSCGMYGVQLLSTTSDVVRYFNIRKMTSDLATTTVLGSNPPIHVSVGRNVGSGAYQGLTLEKSVMTGGYRGVEFVQATTPTAEGIDEPNRPRNCLIEDASITGTTQDGIAIDQGSGITITRARVDQAGQYGISIGRKCQGFVQIDKPAVTNAQKHGLFDDALFAARIFVTDGVFHSNGQATTNTYSGIHASRGAQNLAIVDCASGYSSSSASAFGWVNIASNPANAQTITLNGTVVTWKTAPSGALDVLIGASVAASLLNLYNVVVASADTQLVKCRYATDDVSKFYIIYNAPGDTAGNSFTLAKSGASMTLSGATLSGAAGPFGQQKYGVEGVTDGKAGCWLQGFDGRSNVTGSVG
jgi:hypothetical protein